MIYKIVASAGGRGFVAAFNFALNIVLIREFSPRDFGIFALAMVVAQIWVGVSNALVTTPISIYTAGIKNSQKVDYVLAVLTCTNIAVTAVAAVVMTIGVALFLADYALAFASGFFVAGLLLRQFYQGLAFARRLPAVYFGSDLVFFIIAASMVLAPMTMTDGGLATPVIFVFLGVANIIAAILSAGKMRARVFLRFRRSFFTYYYTIWIEVRWSLLSYGVAMVRAQSHSFIVTLLMDPAAFAPLAAASILYRPIRLVLISWQMVVRPDFSQFYAEKEFGMLRKAYRKYSHIFAAAVLVYVTSIYLAFDLIFEYLFFPKYDKDVVAMAVAMFGAAALITGYSFVFALVMQSMRAFRDLMLAHAVGTVATLITVTGVVFLRDAPTSVVGLVVGELVTVILIVRYLNKNVLAGSKSKFN